MTKYRSQFLDLHHSVRLEVEFETDLGYHHAKKYAWDVLGDRLDRDILGTRWKAHPDFYSMMYLVEVPDVSKEAPHPVAHSHVETKRMAAITRRITFEAAHYLGTWLWSKCHNPHGHSYKLEVTVSGLIGKDGSVMDFEELGRVLKEEVHAELDHRVINEVLDVTDATAEVICEWIWNKIDPRLSNEPSHRLVCLTLYETENCWVTYYGMAHAGD